MKKQTIRVIHVEVSPEGRKERVLKGKELEQWKKEHGFIKEENKYDNTDDKS